MHNNGSVMNGLHKISGKIAEASRPSVSAPPDNPWMESPVTPPQVQSPEPPQGSPAADVPPARVKEGPEQKKTSGSLLGDALLRRYEDYLKTRKDLSGRIVRQTEALRARQEELQQEAEKIRTHLELLEKFAETTSDTDDLVDPGDQAAFAAECRKIEHIRLEVFRISDQTEALAGKESSGKANGDTADSLLPLLDSLSFGQLARAGFAFFFPFLVTLILATLILAAAIVLSFNGTFVW